MYTSRWCATQKSLQLSMGVRGIRARTLPGVAVWSYATALCRSVQCVTIISKVHYVPDQALEPTKLTWSQRYVRGFGASRND